MTLLKKTSFIFIYLLIVSIFIFGFLKIFQYNDNSSFLNDFKYEKIRYYENERINDTVNSIVNTGTLISNKVYDKHYVNVVGIIDNEYKSYIFNYYSGNDILIEDLFKNDGYQLFLKKIKENLLLKYPEFVAEELLKSEVAYEILENKIIVHYNKPELLINMTEEYFVEINYVELIIDNVNVLNYSFKLDANYVNPNIYQLDPNKKTIAFSFDDGPSGLKTEKIINTLNRNHANASFFLVGNKVNSYKNCLKLMQEGNHEIGNHSYNHANLTKLKNNGLTDNITKTDNIIKDITGSVPVVIRPPYGSVNDYVINSIDKTFYLWSVDTNDWHYRDTNYIVNHIITHAKDGDIVLMHDSYDTTVKAVEEVLPKLYLMGYQVTSVSKLAEFKGINVEHSHVYRSFK